MRNGNTLIERAPFFPDSGKIVAMARRKKIPAEQLPNRLREIRLQRKMTLAELSRLVGMPAQNIQAYEIGTYQLRVQHLEQFARALSCDPADFLRTTESGRTSNERELLERYRHLPPQEQQRLIEIVRAYTRETAAA